MTTNHSIFTMKLELIGTNINQSQDAKIVLRTPIRMTKTMVSKLLRALGLQIRKINTNSLPIRRRCKVDVPTKKIAKRICIRMIRKSFDKHWASHRSEENDNIL